MISLRRYWTAFDRSDRPGVLQRVLGLVLEGVAVHAVNCDAQETGVFQNTVRTLGADLTREGLPGPEMLVTTGSIIQAMDQHERHCSRVTNSERRDFQSMVAALLSVIARVCRGNERTASSLIEIEKQVVKATQLDDIHAVKAKLEVCLAGLRLEAEMQAEEARSTREALHAAAASPVAAAATVPSGDDAVTGLPRRGAAIQALTALFSSKSASYAVPVFLDNLPVVRARFGHETADRMVLLVAQLLGQKLGNEDRLFRWSAGALLALVQRDASLDSVRSEFNRLAASRLEHIITIDQRTVLLPVQFSFTCLPVWQSPDVESLTGGIETFILKRATGGA